VVESYQSISVHIEDNEEQLCRGQCDIVIYRFLMVWAFTEPKVKVDL
jgi:hypothetical protein